MSLERLSRALRKMEPGTVGGLARSATPVAYRRRRGVPLAPSAPTVRWTVGDHKGDPQPPRDMVSAFPPDLVLGEPMLLVMNGRTPHPTAPAGWTFVTDAVRGVVMQIYAKNAEAADVGASMTLAAPDRDFSFYIVTMGVPNDLKIYTPPSGGTSFTTDGHTPQVGRTLVAFTAGLIRLPVAQANGADWCAAEDAVIAVGAGSWAQGFVIRHTDPGTPQVWRTDLDLAGHDFVVHIQGMVPGVLECP